jgi:myo-inositol 2-dehydrogenase/D-chiro-inositol 1-dehydrogenase
MSLKVAVIGAGRRGRAHTMAVGDCEDLGQVVAIADIDQERAAALAGAEAPYAATFTDAAAMVEQTAPDVVVVTSPPPLHHEHVTHALARGAHVILEKPIALSMSEADAIGEAADRAGRLVHVCHQLRYGPGIDELRALLSNQAVALTHIWNYRKGPDIPGNWSRSWGGGHVVEWGIHYLDLCRYLMSTEAVSVYARYADQVLRGQPTWDNWDAYSLTIQWANGAVGSYASTYALKPGIEPAAGLEIVAADGKATLAWNETSWTTPVGRDVYTRAQGGQEQTLQRSFLEAVTSGDPSRLRQSYGDALKTHRLVLAANESALSGQVVEL